MLMNEFRDKEFDKLFDLEVKEEIFSEEEIF